MALAAQHDLNVNQLDITTAYLNGELQEIVHMEVSTRCTVEVLEKIIQTEPKSNQIRKMAAEMLDEFKYNTINYAC